MKKNKLISLLLTITTLFIGIISINNVVSAENWDEPVMTLGTSLTPSQKEGTITVLSNRLDDNNYKQITVNGDILVKYLNPSGSNFTSNSGAWSSALIKKTSSGSGINVEIIDYNHHNNITTITEDQYKNAALTAGITDANIYVTSATPIDGSGALAGIYAAYSQNGESLNQDQVSAAQDEMNTLSDITEANKNKDGYSDEQLNNAMAGAKSDMAEKGSGVTVNEITTIVNNQISDNDLNDSVTNNQKQQLVKVLVAVRDSGALDNNNFKSQADKLGKNIKKSAGDIFNKLNTEKNRNFFQKMWDGIVNFFSNLLK